jgi:glycerate kinase
MPQSGIELVLNTIDFKNIIDGSDLVVTGEGRLDNQTLMGKAPVGVLRYAKEQDIPCVAVGGSVLWSEELHNSDFAAIYAATPKGMPLEEAMRADVAAENLRRVAAKVKVDN